jgi:hypothetical protein
MLCDLEKVRPGRVVTHGMPQYGHKYGAGHSAGVLKYGSKTTHQQTRGMSSKRTRQKVKIMMELCSPQLKDEKDSAFFVVNVTKDHHDTTTLTQSSAYFHFVA